MKLKFSLFIFATVIAITAAVLFSFTLDLGQNLRSNGRDFRQVLDWAWESLSPGAKEEVTQTPPVPVAESLGVVGGPSTRLSSTLPSEEENADFYARTGIWQIPPVSLPQPSGLVANINPPSAQAVSSPASISPPPIAVALTGHLQLPQVDTETHTLGPASNGGEENDAPVMVVDVLPSSVERYALVVGIDEYQSISDLQKARNDAIAVSEVLEANGFNVTTLLDADQREFSAAVSALASTLSEDDEAFFYFAGHGVEVDGRNYLLPADIPALTAGDEFLLDSTSISADRALSAIQGSGARVTVMVLDACRDNPFSIDGRRSLGQSRGLAAIEVPEGAFIIYAAGIGQSALDRLSDDDPDPNSVFTRVLLPLLAQPDLPIHEVARQIRREVSALASSINHDQRPAYYDEMLGEFMVAESPNASGLLGIILQNRVETGLIAPAENAATVLEDSAGVMPSDFDFQSFRNDVLECWNVGSLSSEALGTTVTLEVTMEPDGRPQSGSIRLLESSGGSDAFVMQAFEAARRAVIRCGASGYDLPVESYDHWRIIEITFNPGDIRLRPTTPASTAISAEEAYQRGREFRDGLRGREVDLTEAVRWFRLAAEQGLADAQSSLGLMYANGYGVPRNYEEALRWYRLAAEQGQSGAQFFLGLMYYNGWGIERNFSEAAQWYRLAAEQGHVSAQRQLGFMYRDGRGVPQDEGEARRWLGSPLRPIPRPTD